MCLLEMGSTNGIMNVLNPNRIRLDKRGVDIMLERLGFSVHNKEANEVKLSDYLLKDEGDSKLSIKNDKRERELRKLKWEMKDKENFANNMGTKRLNQGKKCVSPWRSSLGMFRGWVG